MIILCEYCDYRCICYDDWVEHLVDNGHQQVISQEMTNWPLELNERSLVVVANGNFQPTKPDICWFFAKYGLITDAYFGNGVESFVIQLDKKEYALHALEEDLTMEDTKLCVRLKTEFSSAEWQSLMDPVISPMPKTFQEHHFEMLTALKFIPDLNDQLDFFIHEISMKPAQIAQRQQLIHTLSKILQRDFPLSELCSYRECGIESIRTTVQYLHFDVYGQSLNYKPLPVDVRLPSKEEIFEKFKLSMTKVSNFGFYYRNFSVQQLGDQPCIKFVESTSNIEFKITFEDLLPFQMWKMLRFLIKLDPRLLPFFRLIGYWANHHKIIGYFAGRLTFDSLYLLLIVFLTMKRLIPSISVLQTMSNRRMVVNGWDASFCEDEDKISNVMSFIGSPPFQTDPRTGKPTAYSILELAAEFFKMYAHSDLQSQVICPLIGDLLPKSMFYPGTESQLPQTLNNYKSWAFAQEPGNRFDTKSPLCIQHPFDLSCNFSSHTGEATLVHFQFLCLDTLEILQRVLNSPNPSLMDMFKPVASPNSGNLKRLAADENVYSNPCPIPPKLLKSQQNPHNYFLGTQPRLLPMQANSAPPKPLFQSPPNVFFSFPQRQNYNVPIPPRPPIVHPVKKSKRSKKKAQNAHGAINPNLVPLLTKKARKRALQLERAAINPNLMPLGAHKAKNKGQMKNINPNVMTSQPKQSKKQGNSSTTATTPAIPTLSVPPAISKKAKKALRKALLENDKLIDYPLYVKNPLATSEEPQIVFDSQSPIASSSKYTQSTTGQETNNILTGKQRRTQLRAERHRLKMQELQILELGTTVSPSESLKTPESLQTAESLKTTESLEIPESFQTTEAVKTPESFQVPESFNTTITFDCDEIDFLLPPSQIPQIAEMKQEQKILSSASTVETIEIE